MSANPIGQKINSRSSLLKNMSNQIGEEDVKAHTWRNK